MMSFFSTIKSRIIEIWRHAGFQKYFRNTGWMFFGQMFRMVVTFFVGAWVARYLGPKNYGVINYAFAFVGIFTFIANLGISTILSRDLVKFPEKKNILMGTSFTLQTIGGVLAFCLIVISAFIFESSSFNRGLIILYGTSFLWSAFGVISIFFQSTVQAKKNVSFSVISSVVASVLKVFLIIFGGGIIWLMLIFIFESLLNTCLSILIYKKSGFSLWEWKFDKKYAKEILFGGWLLMLAAAASYIFTKVDQVMVKHLLNEASVGFYAAAVRLVEIWYFVPGIICSSLFPAIVNAKKDNEKKYYLRLKRLCILLAVIAILVAIPTTILASFVINLLFGSAYIQAVGILQIYVWSGVGLFVLWGLQQYLMTENKLKTIFYVYLFLMVFNIVLNWFLIPFLGLTGAAWATLISYSVGPLVVLFFQSLNLNKLKMYLRN